MFELEESLDDLQATASKCEEIVDVTAAAQLLEAMDQMNTLQIKFSEQVKQHMFTTDEENKQLKAALNEERSKVASLETEVENLKERLQKANEHQLKEMNDMESEVKKARNIALEFKTSLKKKKAQYRECHAKYLKYKKLSRQRKQSVNEITTSLKRKSDVGQAEQGNISPPKKRQQLSGRCDCTKEMGKVKTSDNCIWHSTALNCSLLLAAAKFSDE